MNCNCLGACIFDGVFTCSVLSEQNLGSWRNNDKHLQISKNFGTSQNARKATLTRSFLHIILSTLTSLISHTLKTNPYLTIEPSLLMFHLLKIRAPVTRALK